MISTLWRLSRGHRLRPWRSPYLKWRIETYWGLHADRLSDTDLRMFTWKHRSELFRFLKWAARMERMAGAPPSHSASAYLER